MNSSPRPTNEQDQGSSAGKVIETPCPRQKKPSTKIGENETPGLADEGTVLDSIETAIARRVQSHPKITLREMYNRVSVFPVVLKEGREVCHFYISECLDHYRALCDGFPSGQSVAASIVHTDDRSQVLSVRSSRTSAPSSADGGLLSTLALEDRIDTIEIILPNDDFRPMRLAKRDGDKSYISPAIVDRCGLEENTESKIVVELRYTSTVKNRVRLCRVPGCLFRVRAGLETDLAIGREVQEKLEEHLEQPEYSYDLDTSSDDPASINGRRKPASLGGRKVTAWSDAGSSHRGSVGTVTTNSMLNTFNRIIDMEINSRSAEDGRMHGNRHDHHDRRQPLESSSRGRPRPRQDLEHDSEHSNEAGASRRRRG